MLFSNELLSAQIFNKYVHYWLAAILLLAFGLRLHNLDAHGLFFDEKATMVAAQGMIQDGGNQHDVWDFGKYTFTNEEFWRAKSITRYYEAITASDIGNSPFYYLLLHNWLKITGISDFNARLFSVIFSTLTVLLLFFFTRHFLQSKAIALTASALAAVEPFFVAYAQQARNYSLTFFLTLLATYCFLRALEVAQQNRSRVVVARWFLGYGLVAGLSLLSHFLAITVFLAHGLYALLFVRNLKTWLALGLAGILAVSGLAWWMNFGGGVWTLRSLAHQSAVYLECATNRPYTNPYGIILPATIQNVAQKSLPIFSDLWIFSNGLVDKLTGKRNLFLALFWGVSFVFLYRFARQKHPQLRWLVAAAVVGTLGSCWIYSNHALGFVVLSGAVFMTYLVAETFFTTSIGYDKKLLWFFLILGLFPTFFLIFNAFRSGHTYGLTQRYSGFSFPYVIILASIALGRLCQMKNELKYLIMSILLVQLLLIGQTLQTIYADVSLKYNYRLVARLPNPHQAAAVKAVELYKTGDTLLLPAPKNVFDNAMDRTYLPHSVVDAQYFNLYLPKAPIFVQKLDTLALHKIVLKKASGQLIELMDLKGKRY